MRRRLLLAASGLTCGLFAVRFLFSGLRWAVSPLSGDFAAAWPSGPLAWLRPDFPVTQVIGSEQHLWNYGPVMHVITLPLFLAPSWRAVPPMWAAINVLALAGSFLLCLDLSGHRRRLGASSLLLLAAAWLAYQPLSVCLRQGNIEIVEFLFILIGLKYLHFRRDSAAGAVLGVATMIKFLPIGFVGWLTLRGRWRAAAVGLTVIAAIAAVTAVTLDWRRSVAIVDVMPRASDANVYSIHFMSVSSMFLHRTSEIDWGLNTLRWLPEGRHAAAARAGTLATAALAACYALWFLRRRRRPIQWEEMGVLFLLMFLLPPWNHEDYFIFALMPFTALIADAIVKRDAAAIAAAAVAFMLISPPVPFSILERTGWFPHSYAYFADIHDLPFWGAMLLLVTVTSRADAGGPASAALEDLQLVDGPEPGPRAA